MLDEVVGWIVEIVGSLGYPGIFALMFLESSFFPFPSEVVIVPAGYLAAEKELNLALVVVCGTAGSLSGAIFNYYLALTLGRSFILRYGRYFLITEKTLARVEHFFYEHGEISTLIGRLIPGLRQYISFPAGLGRMGLLRFSLFTVAGAGIWVAILALIGYFVGSNIELVEAYSSLAVKTLILFSIILAAAYILMRRAKLR